MTEFSFLKLFLHSTTELKFGGVSSWILLTNNKNNKSAVSTLLPDRGITSKIKRKELCFCVALCVCVCVSLWDSQCWTCLYSSHGRFCSHLAVSVDCVQIEVCVVTFKKWLELCNKKQSGAWEWACVRACTLSALGTDRGLQTTQIGLTLKQLL